MFVPFRPVGLHRRETLTPLSGCFASFLRGALHAWTPLRAHGMTHDVSGQARARPATLLLPERSGVWGAAL
jgi:hypothetical protein